MPCDAPSLGRALFLGELGMHAVPSGGLASGPWQTAGVCGRFGAWTEAVIRSEIQYPVRTTRLDHARRQHFALVPQGAGDGELVLVVLENHALQIGLIDKLSRFHRLPFSIDGLLEEQAASVLALVPFDIAIQFGNILVAHVLFGFNMKRPAIDFAYALNPLLVEFGMGFIVLRQGPLRAQRDRAEIPGSGKFFGSLGTARHGLFHGQSVIYRLIHFQLGNAAIDRGDLLGMLGLQAGKLAEKTLIAGHDLADRVVVIGVRGMSGQEQGKRQNLFHIK
ncbi:hypothetical protein CV_1053 [Chromobacterium violaceum ATCC 12472]|uniref:Uncharacterized protein n=1 Tax=Chromobacterium violaceum (strain ATCC 12472 / DSM 30191 / JCM 1249 / CCUG 213 / NBRC 12614 / NCIMB 9131 / NCTC 9757 / MK) TaxID=243365 RepID=Q7NZ69_CHRVO|nr:hypothetical protein CV_1053 [Chromobacterium violaceum ATCC 12472]